MNHRTRVAVERQITAMGADVFEVGLSNRGYPATHLTSLKCCRACGIGRLYSGPSLGSPTKTPTVATFMSAPKGSHLSLVDNLTAAAVQKMKNEGFTPALLVETSPGNFQAWLNHGQVLQKQLSTLAARTWPSVSAATRSRRLATLRQIGRADDRKPKHRAEDGRYPSCISYRQPANRTEPPRTFFKNCRRNSPSDNGSKGPCRTQVIRQSPPDHR